MTQQEAYQECMDIAEAKNWRATYFALEEDGFDDQTDFIYMLKVFQDSCK